MLLWYCMVNPFLKSIEFFRNAISTIKLGKNRKIRIKYLKNQYQNGHSHISFKKSKISTKLDLPAAQDPIKRLDLLNSTDTSLKVLKFLTSIFDNLIKITTTFFVNLK